MNIFYSKYGLDPYDVLGVSKEDSLKKIKKYYLKKALILHPDKTGGKTKKEFQILKEAYNSILNDFETREILDSLDDRKSRKRIPTKEIFPNTFNSQINKDSLSSISSRNVPVYAPFLEDRLKDKFITPRHMTSYDSSLPQNTNYINISMKDFNQTFDYYKQKTEEEMQLMEVKEVKPVKEYTELEYSKVYVYNGILVTQTDEELEEEERKRYKKKFSLKNPDIQEFEKEKEIIKKFKPRKVQEKEVKNTQYKNLDIKYQQKFSDTEFEMRQLQEHKKHLEKCKNKIYKDPRISNYLLEQAQQGQLEASSLKEEDLKSFNTLKNKIKLIEDKKPGV